MLLADAPARPGTLFAELVPWLISLVLVVAVGAVVIYLVRRAMGANGTVPDGFSLHELRKLHDAGNFTDEEYERAKASIIGRLSATDEDPPRDAQSSS